MLYYILGAGAVVMIIWVAGSYYAVRSIEEPAYTVLEKKNEYEVREYAPYIMAVTTVSGEYDAAINSGFRIIADYIFGNNTSKETIAMTAPVLESPDKNTSEKIAMTVPVLESSSGSATRTVAFVLPSKYTLETLPRPNNSAVRFETVPARKVAALSFSWYASAKRLETKKVLLQNYLKRDGYMVVGAALTARYNPPFTMPLLLRNEILIPIQ